MSHYDILVLGCRDSDDLDAFLSVLRSLVADSGLPEADVRFVTEASGYGFCDHRRPAVCACFRSASQSELAVIQMLLRSRVPVIPIARTGERFEDFPSELQPLNGACLPDRRDQWSIAGAAILESVGLLRSQRRLFVSYRRTEAREAAVQLHDGLSGRGFQIFLDTHVIRPGKVFQDQLWHSLCDSDVMLMLDTATYFDSKWTRAEFGRAQSIGVSIMRLIFPTHTPNPATDFTASHTLQDTDFDGERLRPSVVEELIARVERLRARSIAARLLEMTGKLKAEVEATGGRLDGAGAFRSVAMTLRNGTRAWAYPVIGVPTAKLLYDIVRRAEAANQRGPYLVYDHTGIADDWLDHLAWLDRKIGDVEFMRVSETAGVISRRVVS